MTKKFFFAALAAVILSLGFTACSDDDDNNSGNSFKETYYLKYSFVGATDKEEDLIHTTYRNAIGMVPDTLSYDSVIVEGKDSADCVAKFKAMIEPANKKLDAMTFDSGEDNSVYIYNSKENLVMVKTIGAAENKTKHPVFADFTASDSYRVDHGYVGDFFVVAFPLSMGKCETNRYKSCDVNMGTGFWTHNVYILANLEWAYHSVTDVVILNSHSTVGDCPEEISYNGGTYYLAKNNFNNFDPDLNNGARTSPDLYLYYRYGDRGDRKLLIEPITIAYADNSINEWGDYKYSSPSDDLYSFYTKYGHDVEYAPMIRYDKSSKQYVKEADCANLNEGAGGKYMYLRLIYQR